MDVEIEEFQLVLNHNSHMNSNYYRKYFHTNNVNHYRMMNIDHSDLVVDFYFKITNFLIILSMFEY